MNVLIVGGGGREHAIGWKLNQNPDINLYFAPGNAGTSTLGESVNISENDIDCIAEFAHTRHIDLTVVGSELPLVLGIVDVFHKRGLRIFGPDVLGAMLEGSKVFAKDFMSKYDIPTAEHVVVTSVRQGLSALRKFSYPSVIKVDGLADGKGVTICHNRAEAKQTLKNIFDNHIYGEAGNKAVIEEYLKGDEISLLCFTDGETILPMETASDYKRVGDNDTGMNTGGMGSISPSPYYKDGMCDEIARKTLEGIKAEGFDYRGVLYIGIIVTAGGPMVLEYNVRFGDPEAEAILPRMETDLSEIMNAVIDRRLNDYTLKWNDNYAVSVVIASEGYPNTYNIGYKVSVPEDTKSIVFHAETKLFDGDIVTNGGRVVVLTALGEDFDKAREAVYGDIAKIEFQGSNYRKDIGLFIDKSPKNSISRNAPKTAADDVPKRKRIPTAVKVILAIIIPISVLFAAVYMFGLHIQNEARIFPSIIISGTNVSGLTKSEAIQALGVSDYDERINNARVMLIFPDASTLEITGNDVNLRHDALNIVADVFNVGRSRGLIPGVLSYIYMRLPEFQVITHEIYFSLDAEMLRSITAPMTVYYNEKLDSSIPEILDDRIVFTKGAGHVNADPDAIFSLVHSGLFESFEIGAPVEIVYELTPSDTIFNDVMALREQVFVEVVSAEFDIDTNAATPCTVGVDFDFVEAARVLRETKDGATVEFELLFTYPEYSQEQLDELLFRDLLGERTTFVHGSAARVNNVTLSAEIINGHVLLPGEEFSFNRVVGRRTREAGFQAAPAIVSGEMVNVRGGGVCQTSSTLFASIRPTELRITQQQRHSRPVPYLPWGWDAAVWYPILDFRFENNTAYPLLIIMEFYERRLTSRVYGTIIDDFPIAISDE